KKLRVDTKNDKSGLCLKIASQNSAEYEKVNDLLKIFFGDFPVYMYFEDEKKLVLAPKKLWVSNSKMLISELSSVLGETNVVVK
ncbi:MAG: hypothetical protein RR848_07395, partial [Oscillospiraceae bacterium]